MSLKVLFAISRDFWCFMGRLVYGGRSLTLRQEIEQTPLANGDNFKQIGLTLRGARRSQGCSVKEVSEQLRISVDYLTMLEAGAFDELPAPAYVTGFLRSYGRFVGLDPDTLVTRYLTLNADKDPAPSYKTPMSAHPPQRSAPAVASILVLCAGLVYGGWFWLNAVSPPVLNVAETGLKTAMLAPNHESISGGVTSLDTPSMTPPASNNMADRTVKPIPSPIVETTVMPSIHDLEPAERKQTERLAKDFALSDRNAAEPTVSKVLGGEVADIDTSVLRNTETLGGETDLKAAEAHISTLPGVEKQNTVLLDELTKTQILPPSNATPEDLRTSNTAIAHLRDPAKEITIQAVAASWVEIVRDNGEEVMAKLMQAGDSYVVDGNTRLYLSTGNAGGLMVVIGAGDPVLMGDIGEIVRDLPLVIDKLRKIL
jgi:cytoskeleton protein RodZ